LLSQWSVAVPSRAITAYWIQVPEGVSLIGCDDLPLAGLMGTEMAEIVAARAESIVQGFRACGCKLNNPNMQLSLLGLVVIPELRISDMGLVDTTRFKFLPVVDGPAK
jgi:adenine deaminase